MNNIYVYVYEHEQERQDTTRQDLYTCEYPVYAPFSLFLLPYVFFMYSTFFPFCLSYSFVLLLLLVSWCSWLSHHFYVVRVPGSSPGGTIIPALF